MGINFYRYIKFISRLTGLIFLISLVSCGGSGSGSGLSYSVSGTISGLQGSVVIQNNTTDVITLSSSGSFSFPNKVNDGASYNVVVRTQPESQTCTISNAGGLIRGADITDVDIVCVTTRFSLSGSYRAAALVQVDSDINDPFAVANISNNYPDTQSIPNFSIVHGFATQLGTGRVLDGDRFASTADEFDFYRVNLQENQILRLQVVDYAGLDVFQGDLDLYLYDVASRTLQGFSESTGEFENITVPADGDYFIKVQASNGSSKYILSLNSVAPVNVTSTRQSSVDFRPGEAIIKFKANAQVNNFKASNQQMTLRHAKTTRATLANFSILGASNASGSSGSKTGSSFLDELQQKNFTSYQKVKTLREIKRLKMRDDIEYAEPNYIYRPLLVPNDTYYNFQWHYPAINLPQAWDITTGARAGNNVIVAVVDTGVFLDHPELLNQRVSGYDFISDIQNAADGDGIDANPDDPGDGAQLNTSSWHGTHVAGTVAAETNNNVGVAGVAWQAKIMPLRVLGTQGGTDYDIRQAILYAAGLDNDSGTFPIQKADIINLSLGGSGSLPDTQAVYNLVRAAGVIVVAAAGNENSSKLSYPASYDGVISVSATDFADNRAPYSNYGSRVDVAAPGGNQGVDLNDDGYGDGVLSTLVDDSSGTRQPSYNFSQGTSMASPHVAGVFALMRAVHPKLSPDDVDSLLASGSLTTDLGTEGRDDFYGHGLIDALKAVQIAQQLGSGVPLPPQPALIVATPNRLVLGNTSVATLVLSNQGDEIASVTGVGVDAAWLGVVIAAGNMDPNGLGEYEVTINRSVLSATPSSYLGTITFTLSIGDPLVVEVFMDVGVVDKTGNLGSIYLLLLDENYNVIDFVSGVDDGNGNFNYSFANVAAGGYRIAGGSDIDNDLFVCQLGEACGGYPTIDALSIINVVDADISGLDFIVDILANFGASSLSTDLNLNIGSSGFKRIVTPTTHSKQLAQ